MKKLLLLFVLLMTVTTYAQEQENKFPYGKMLNMSHDELIDAKFKFDNYRNQYVLTKTNGLNATANILGALSGTPTNYIPHVNDYTVVIQKGVKEIAYIEVAFYDSKLYHELLTFAADSGKDLLETNSSSLTKTQFNYSDYSFILTSKTNKQSSTTAGGNKATTKDDTYSIYTFTINTGAAPASDWLTKEAAKAAKRDAKGQKKRSAADLM